MRGARRMTTGGVLSSLLIVGMLFGCAQSVRGVQTAGYAHNRHDCSGYGPLPQKYQLISADKLPAPFTLVQASPPEPVIAVKYAECLNVKTNQYEVKNDVLGVYLTSPAPTTTPTAGNLTGSQTYYLTPVDTVNWVDPLKQLKK